MKKILAGTTALIAVGTLAGAAQAAEPIKLSVGGFMNQWVGYANWTEKNQKEMANGTTGQDYNMFGINSDTEIHFKGETVLDNGLKVSVVIMHEAERTSATNRNADQQYAELSGGWGQIRVGETMNAATRVHNQAPGAGAAFSDVTAFTAAPLPSGNTVTDLSSQYTSVDGVSEKHQTSIDYVSPMFGPFAFGITYVPALGGVGSGPGRGIVEEHTTVHDLVGGALVYADTWGPVGIKADIAYARWDANGLSTSTAVLAGSGRAIPVGLVISYAGFDVGGSYIRIWDNYKNGIQGSTGNTLASMDGHAWDAGIAYTTGNWKFGYQYYSSQFEGGFSGRANGTAGGTDRTSIHNGGVAYTMGPGVVVTGNVAYQRMSDEAGTTLDKSTGLGVLSGLLLTF